MWNDLLDKFVREENEKIKKMNQLVEDAINHNENITKKLLRSNVWKLTMWQKMADSVASFWWSRRFIVIFWICILFWIIANIVFLMNKWFDPYPFILLNLILSCLAAIQAPIIMMSQNRKEDIDRIRSENDYIINLKAETQINNIDEKINILIIEHMDKMFKLQEWQLKLLNEIKKIVKK